MALKEFLPGSRVTVLSPHRDDAVFSLAVCIRRWIQVGVKVQIVNFFTESAYAPRAIGTDRSNGFLSSLRRREDRLALRKLSPAVNVRDFGMVDAPVRCGVKTQAVIGPNAIPVREQDVEAVGRELDLLRNSDIYLAPLGLGNHVDHRTVRDAALRTVKAGRLGFYEDLPYATWTSEEQVLEAVQQTGRLLNPRTIRKPNSIIQKRQLAGYYATQIDPANADVIARFLGTRGGERIWIPRHNFAFRRALA